MDDQRVEKVLLWALAQPPGTSYRLGDGREDELGLSEAEIDEAMREAVSRTLLRGDRTNYGPMVTWFDVKVTAIGLRFCAQWPPPGSEHHPGPWDEGNWGTHARPMLERVRDGGYRHDFLPGLDSGTPDEKFRDIQVAHELMLAHYLTAKPQAHRSLSDLRLTASGRRALDFTPRDPVDEARLKLRVSTVDAVVHAVEVALGQRLRALGEKHDLVSTHPGVHQQLSALNDQLAAKGGPSVYGKPWKKLIDALLDVRNEYAHGRAEEMPASLAAWTVATVELLLHQLRPSRSREVKSGGALAGGGARHQREVVREVPAIG
ncbi:MAG: hypothetical protein WKF96_24005 [Solirubrobacteraceae bacterium]